jgi:glucan phosphoethanolaminetransferase (alkaline phosphatase superfamily)
MLKNVLSRRRRRRVIKLQRKWEPTGNGEKKQKFQHVQTLLYSFITTLLILLQVFFLPTSTFPAVAIFNLLFFVSVAMIFLATVLTLREIFHYVDYSDENGLDLDQCR